MNVHSRLTLASEVLDPVHFFTGVVEAHGFVLDRQDRVRRRFSARFEGAPHGLGVSVAEVLDYNDGARDERQWLIEPVGADEFRAEATGLVAPARLLRPQPLECRWTYQMDIPVNGRTLRFSLEDIMVQHAPDLWLSSTPMRKFGITWATIITTYRKTA